MCRRWPCRDRLASTFRSVRAASSFLHRAVTIARYGVWHAGDLCPEFRGLVVHVLATCGQCRRKSPRAYRRLKSLILSQAAVTPTATFESDDGDRGDGAVRPRGLHGGCAVRALRAAATKEEKGGGADGCRDQGKQCLESSCAKECGPKISRAVWGLHPNKSDAATTGLPWADRSANLRILPPSRSGGGIGIHDGLRSRCRKACRFKSCPEHHF
jgi:hypothetical protein